MSTELVLNGRAYDYPEGISNLEALLFYAQRKEAGVNIVVEVEVDGETFSEVYPHEALAMDLTEIERVDVTSISGDQFARGFIEQAPEFVSHIRTGFASAAVLLRSSGNELEGHEIMARSLDALRAFRLHCELVERATASNMNLKFTNFWKTLDPVAEALVNVQTSKGPDEIAGLLDTTLVPFLDSLRATLQ
jgi:hypothetical protein